MESKRERLEGLEHDKDSLLETYAEMAPKALETLTPEERQRLYKTLRLEVLVYADGTNELTGEFVGPSATSAFRSTKTESTSKSVLMVDR